MRRRKSDQWASASAYDRITADIKHLLSANFTAGLGVSAAWEEQVPPVVRFWTDDGDSWGFVFHYVVGIHYAVRQERLSKPGR